MRTSLIVLAAVLVVAFLNLELRGFLAVAVVAALIFAYVNLLTYLRKRSAPVHEAPVGAFRAVELDRYARHIILREIGGPGQRRLKDAKVLVVGAGGLGSPALLYLAASGVGCIGVIDDDVVEGSNLQRQIIHTDQRIGEAKVQSAVTAMKALNPFIEVRPYRRRLEEGIAAGLVGDYDLVLDGSDNFDTRYLVNRVCVAAGKPLISGAITQWEGQVSVFHPASGSPCYECVFPVRPAPGMVPTCAEAGVAAPLPGIIGALMAAEAVKLITGAGEVLKGRLMIHDALYSEVRVIGVSRRAGCPVCGVTH
ncbi:MAG: HesA/MoeB/ThiF family protein [Paracoccaceae bacterium]